MGGVLGEQDDLTKSAYYSQCMWRGGAIPRQLNFTVGNYCWNLSFREKQQHTHKRHLVHTHRSEKGVIIEGCFILILRLLSFSGCSCSPDMLSVSWCGAKLFNGGHAGTFQPAWKLKAIPAPYTRQTAEERASVAVTVTERRFQEEGRRFELHCNLHFSSH